MTEVGDRRIAALFGLLGAALIALDGLIDLARGVLSVALGHGGHAYLPFDQALIFLVVGLVVAVFSVLGGLRRDGNATVAGAVLIVVAIVGWLELGVPSGVLAILGALLVLVAGVVFLVSGR
ncbi:MAG TPA: hypothetical protein VEH10_03945 [Thermoplasmata archaeon]|nr:hypothetical protein [Thermoplasmata archaeon]